MFLNREPILKRLQEHWNYAVRQGIDPDRIVGVFLYGSQNYGFASWESDVDSKLIVVPSFEDMCLKSEWLSKELHLEDEHIEVMIWTNYGTDVHCTTNLNQDSWETAKS